MISQNQLENRIMGLKGIKPRTDWSASLKSRIMTGEVSPAYQPSTFDILINSLSPRYAVVVLSLIILGAGAIFMYDNSRPTEYYLSKAEQQARKVTEAAKSGNKNEVASLITETSKTLKQAAQKFPNTVASKEETESLVSQVASINVALEAARKEVGDNFAKSEQRVLSDKAAECVEKSISSAQRQLASIIENEILALEKTKLTEPEKKILGEAKIEFSKWLEEGNWKNLESAAEKIYQLANQK